MRSLLKRAIAAAALGLGLATAVQPALSERYEDGLVTNYYKAFKGKKVGIRSHFDGLRLHPSLDGRRRARRQAARLRSDHSRLRTGISTRGPKRLSNSSRRSPTSSSSITTTCKLTPSSVSARHGQRDQRHSDEFEDGGEFRRFYRRRLVSALASTKLAKQRSSAARVRRVRLEYLQGRRLARLILSVGLAKMMP